MDLWQRALGEFVDVIDRSEDGSDTLVWRFPRQGNAEGGPMRSHEPQEQAAAEQRRPAEWQGEDTDLSAWLIRLLRQLF